MTQANMPGIPGMEAMSGSLDFIKNMWGGGMQMPGMAMPALSVEDIGKQIADLKAVEAWLQLNMNMLRGTIQALEVQSATLSALQSMGQTMALMMQPAASTDGPAASGPGFSFAAPTADKPPVPEPEPASGQQQADAPQAAFDAAGMAAAMAHPMANPMAWWNMLQDQFKQAVDTAMVPEPESAPAPKAKAKAARPAAKAKPKARAAAATTKKRKPAARL
jgi:hypothetical protein